MSLKKGKLNVPQKGQANAPQKWQVKCPGSPLKGFYCTYVRSEKQGKAPLLEPQARTRGDP